MAKHLDKRSELAGCYLHWLIVRYVTNNNNKTVILYKLFNPLNSVWSSFILFSHIVNMFNNDYNTALIKHNQTYFYLNSGKYHRIPFTGKSH